MQRVWSICAKTGMCKDIGSACAKSLEYLCKDIGSVCAKSLEYLCKDIGSVCAKTLDRCVQRVWSGCANTSVCKSLGMVYVNGEPL